MKDQTQYMPGSHEGWLAKTGGYAKDMALRDYFAAKAMQGMVSRFEANEGLLAAISYKVADAMLKAREA